MLSCDSTFVPANIEKHGGDVDLIFHDCQLEEDGETIHTLLEELLELDGATQEKIILVHYGDNWRDFEGKTGVMALGEQGKRYKF